MTEERMSIMGVWLDARRLPPDVFRNKYIVLLDEEMTRDLTSDERQWLADHERDARLRHAVEQAERRTAVGEHLYATAQSDLSATAACLRDVEAELRQRVAELEGQIAHSAQYHDVACNGSRKFPLGGGGVSICNCIGFWRGAEKRAEQAKHEANTAVEERDEAVRARGDAEQLAEVWRQRALTAEASLREVEVSRDALQEALTTAGWESLGWRNEYDKATTAHQQAEQRVERLEAERDEAERRWRETVDILGQTGATLEQAEQTVAALQATVTRLKRQLLTPDPTRCVSCERDLVRGEHRCCHACAPNLSAEFAACLDDQRNG